jgi:hypothetical protein
MADPTMCLPENTLADGHAGRSGGVPAADPDGEDTVATGSVPLEQTVQMNAAK